MYFMHLLSTIFVFQLRWVNWVTFFLFCFWFLMFLAVPCLEGFVHTLDLILVSELVIYNELKIWDIYPLSNAG